MPDLNLSTSVSRWNVFRQSPTEGQRSWLIRRACWRVRDGWRKTGAEYPDTKVLEQADPHSEEDAVLAVIAADLFWKKITTATEVSPRAARAAYLAWNEGWTVSEIAEFLGVARRTVSRDLGDVRTAARQPGRATSLEGGEA